MGGATAAVALVLAVPVGVAGVCLSSYPVYSTEYVALAGQTDPLITISVSYTPGEPYLGATLWIELTKPDTDVAYTLGSDWPDSARYEGWLTGASRKSLGVTAGAYEVAGGASREAAERLARSFDLTLRTGQEARRVSFRDAERPRVPLRDAAREQIERRFCAPHNRLLDRLLDIGQAQR